MPTKKDNLVSVGVFVYNEEKNIGFLLEGLNNQNLSEIEISEIIVVSSGSTDNTNKIVNEMARKNKKIKLIEQKTREGKASAMNLFLKNAKSELIVIESGDTIPHKDCIENLCKPLLKNSQLGLTGARLIPTNNKKTCLGYIIHYWWWMHNELPRFGEIIAFRKSLVPQISSTTAVDEADAEAIVINKGFKTMAVGTAVANNHGAETFNDLIKQRKRVYVGHKLLKREKHYTVESFNQSRLLNLTLKYIKKEKNLLGILYISFGILIEFYSRLLGFYDLHFKKKNPFIWDISESTKKVTTK